MGITEIVKRTSLMVFSTLASLEAASCAALRLQIVPGHVPTYHGAANPAFEFWSDINPQFGVWHFPHAEYRHKKACFDVTYRTNSVGARDRERTIESARPRVIVLGDSFVEGYGVKDGARLTDRLEASTGIEHLNFGTSGDFGPTQYLLLYQSLAKHYRHDAVLVEFLPANDFDDDDPGFGKKAFKDRYRPYFVGQDPNYRLEYFLDDITKSSYRTPPDTFRSRLVNFLRETSHAYNLYAYFRAIRDRESAASGKHGPESRYYHFTEAELLRLRFVLQRLTAEGGGRPVTVFTIPTARDLKAYEMSGDAPLSRRLAAMSQEVGFELVDLLPAFARQRPAWRSLFLQCDAHWSEAGNATATNILLSPTRKVAGQPATHTGAAH